jgi:malate synthase
VKLVDGRTVTPELVRQLTTEELDKVRQQVGDEFFYGQGRPEESRAIFEQVALADDYADFLTLVAYEHID